MNYLVMETKRSYAVLLDQEGRFLKAANLHYQVGQTVTDPVLLREKSEKGRLIPPVRRGRGGSGGCGRLPGIRCHPPPVPAGHQCVLLHLYDHQSPGAHGAEQGRGT